MYCQNCGYELKEGDKYCENCGAKIETEPTKINKIENDYVKQINQDNQNVNKKSNNKVIITILISILIIALGVFLFFGSQPKDINLRVIELVQLIQNKEEVKYSGDNIHVEGYVLLDLEQYNGVELNSDYFILVPSMNEDSIEYMLFCKNIEVLPENLGTGSEVILHGKLDINEENFTTTLDVESIEIINKVEPVVTVNSVTELLENSNKYLNKTVSVISQLTVTNMNGAYISDDLFSKAIWLYGISNQELADIYMNGGWCTTTGKLVLDGSNFAIEVENIELYEVDNTKTDEIYSIDDIIGYPLGYIDTYMTLKGWQPMDLATDKHGNYVDTLRSDDGKSYVIIEGNKNAIELETGEIAYYGFLILRDEELVLVTE